MSADNWAQCPRCSKKREDAVQASLEAVNAAYGHISVAEFDAMRAEHEAFAREEMDYTFREDYEIWGAEEGVIQVNYSGGCSKCGLGLKFEHEHPLAVGE